MPPRFRVTFRVPQPILSTIDYDWVNIAGERVLLPITSDNRFTTSQPYGTQTKLFQDRNFIRFKTTRSSAARSASSTMM